jgi:hypothetical protein
MVDDVGVLNVRWAVNVNSSPYSSTSKTIILTLLLKASMVAAMCSCSDVTQRGVDYSTVSK